MDTPEEDRLALLASIDDPNERAKVARMWGVVEEAGEGRVSGDSGPDAGINRAFFEPPRTKPTAKGRKRVGKPKPKAAKNALHAVCCPNCGYHLA